MVDDELNQSQNHNPEAEGVEQEEASRISELEDLLAQKDEELTEANARILELEQAVAELSGKLTIASSSLAEAVASYRTMVVQANPDVLEELSLLMSH